MLDTLFRDDDLHEKLESLGDQLSSFDARLTALEEEMEQAGSEDGAESGAVPSRAPEVHEDPNAAFHTLVGQQRDLRRAVGQRGPGGLQQYLPDEASIAAACQSVNEGIGGAFIFAYANEFGRPAVFLPSGREPKVALTAVLDAIYEQKWDATDLDLRRARRDILDIGGSGIHKALPAVVSARHDRQDDEAEEVVSVDGGMAARYDISPPAQSNEYNWLTIREPVGLLAYIANGDQTDDLTVGY